MVQQTQEEHNNSGKYLLWDFYSKAVKMASVLEGEGIDLGELRTELDAVGVIYDREAEYDYNIAERLKKVSAGLLAAAAKH